VEAVLQQLLDGVDQELQLHDGYAASWGVDSKQLAAPSAATKAYTDFLMQVANDPEVSKGLV
jgi:thiaminase/transcriptional activator TenA